MGGLQSQIIQKNPNPILNPVHQSHSRISIPTHSHGQVLSSMVDFQSKIGTNYLFYMPAMALMFVLGYFFLVLSYGTAAPTGLFIPSLVVGAAGGRIVGRAVR